VESSTRVHRRPLLELLDAYLGQHPDEGPRVDRVRGFVREHPDCFERCCPPGHVTGSAWILSSDRRRVLLVRHRKLGRWLQPGGHADGDPDVLAVALREAREETGLERLALLPGALGSVPLDVDVHEIPARPGEPAHLHHDVRFLLIAEPGQMLRRSKESEDVAWFERSGLARVSDEESLLRMERHARLRLGES
jgi:8-oxo-dGTP pyrophosphatase MutT (NUDIX family)